MTDATDSQPLKVRYSKFSGVTDWVPCANAEILGDALVIDFGGGSRDMIPLHVIRGPIEIRPNNEGSNGD
jgi:hypothetical protein